MSNYNFFHISLDWSSKPAITFDNLPRAMEYMNFLEEQGGTAELHCHTHAWDGTFLYSTELYSFTSDGFRQRLRDHVPFACDQFCSCIPEAVWEIGG